METHNNADILTTSKRIVIILFLAYILILTAILLLNRTLIENDSINKHNYDSFQASSDNIGRLRAYHDLNPDFFTGIISCEFKNLVFTNNPPLVKIGESYLERKIYYRTDGNIGEERGLVDPALYNEMLLFCKTVSKIFAENKTPEIRLRLINKALSDNFSSTELRTFVKNKVLPKIVRIDNRKEWEAVLTWILFPESHGPGKMAGVFGHTAGKISYVNRFSKPWVENHDKFHLYETLSHTKNYEDAEAILTSNWHASYENLKRSQAALPSVSFQTLGFSAKIDDILMISGLLITFFQIIFFILWEMQTKEKTQNDVSTIIAFPFVSCQNDPLEKGSPKGLSGYFQRAIWAAFLIFPSVIISIGILFRFDLYGLLIHHNEPWGDIRLSFLKVLLHYRSNDPLSVVLDLLNLICLSISLLILIKITKSNTDKESIVGSNNKRPRNVIQSYKIVVYYSPLACFLIILTTKYYSVFYNNKEGYLFSSIPTTIIFTLFGVLWTLIFCVSMQRKFRLVRALSSLVMIVVMVLLFF